MKLDKGTWTPPRLTDWRYLIDNFLNNKDTRFELFYGFSRLSQSMQLRAIKDSIRNGLMGATSNEFDQKSNI